MSNPGDLNEKEKTCTIKVKMGDDEEEEEKGGEADGTGGHEEMKVNGDRREEDRVIKVVFCDTMMELIDYVHQHGPGWR